MTVVIKYPNQTKKTNQEFFKRKDKELTNLDWAKWGGWFDTDGSISSTKRDLVSLKLKDREPVELFSKIFETSLYYREFKTITPNGVSYLATEYSALLAGEKAVWFTKNISKYMFNKTMFVKKLLNNHNIPYMPYQHILTKDELINYIASALQGDGSFYDLNKKSYPILFYSVNVNYLKFVRNELEKHNFIFNGPYAGKVYQTKAGTRTQFQISLSVKKHQQAINFFEDVIPKIDMTRKREKAMISLEFLKQ